MSNNMSQTLLIFLIALFLNTGCSSLKYLDSYSGYKGNPNKVESTLFIDDNVKGTKSVYYYDSFGRNIKDEIYKKDGTISSLINYEYDRNGNLIQYKSYNNDGSLRTTISYSYNKWGQEIKKTHNRTTKSTISKTTYDRKNKTAVTSINDGDGAFIEYIKLKYDKNWNKLEIISHTEIGNQRSIIKYKYDEHGNKILSESYDKDNDLNTFYASTYDSYNNRIRVQRFNKDLENKTVLVNDTKTIYKYDKMGNYTEQTHIRIGSNRRTTTKNKYYYSN